MRLTEIKNAQKLIGKQDPYCIVTPVDQAGRPIKSKRLRTKPATDGGRNPVWNSVAVIDFSAGFDILKELFCSI